MSSPTLRTPRLVLRAWREDDLAPFAAMNADARVMEYMPRVLSREESDAAAGRIRDHFERHGFGAWAIEVVGGPKFAGFVGLAAPSFEAHFTPCVEIGWRLAFDQWGRGYATEAAGAAIDFAFGPAGLDQVVSFTVPANHRSRAVMHRLDMTHSPDDDFDHPNLPEVHPLRRHVLYRLRREHFLSSQS